MATDAQRLHYIDWVRLLPFFLLIFFHCAMPFVTFGWEIKNPTVSRSLSVLILWLHQWRLPLLFFISGAGIYYSLRRRSVAAFAWERFVRLFIPLVFAMFFTIPLQVYFERLQKAQISGSYLKFYPSVWNLVPYPEGTLTWSHMWFVVYLFVFCILLLPIFALCKIPVIAMAKEKLSGLLSRPLIAPLLFLPLTFLFYAFFLTYPEQQSLLDDWFLFLFSLTLLLYGFLLGGNLRFWETCEKYRRYFLVFAMITMLCLFVVYWRNLALPTKKNDTVSIYGLLDSVHIWTLILAVLGYAKKYLNFSNPFLRYANQAVYPYYILHQTLIVAFGFYVVQWPMPIAIKMLALIILCFFALLIIYQWLIRPFWLIRILYGLKPRRR